MAMHDYRKLIDDLHTELGETFSLAIEVVDPSAARANEGSMIRVEGLTSFGRGFDPVALTVYDAGVIIDALSGALREITSQRRFSVDPAHPNVVRDATRPGVVCGFEEPAYEVADDFEAGRDNPGRYMWWDFAAHGVAGPARPAVDES
jgi:hypothetical protein